MLFPWIDPNREASANGNNGGRKTETGRKNACDEPEAGACGRVPRGDARKSGMKSDGESNRVTKGGPREKEARGGRVTGGIRMNGDKGGVRSRESGRTGNRIRAVEGKLKST